MISLFVITAKIVPEEINHPFVGQANAIKFLHKGAAQDLKGRLHKISTNTFESRPASPYYYVVEVAYPPVKYFPYRRSAALAPGHVSKGIHSHANTQPLGLSARSHP